MKIQRTTSPSNGSKATKGSKRRKPEFSPAPSASLPLTQVEARIDVGFGNTLFIRGQGNGLSWAKGQPLTCIQADRWVWSAQEPTAKVAFKLLLNDQIWAQGQDIVVEPARAVEIVPHF